MSISNITSKLKQNKILTTATSCLLASYAGYAVTLRHFEKNLYKKRSDEFSSQNLLPEGIKLNLKTNSNANFSAIDINPKNSNKYIIYCNGIHTTMQKSNSHIYKELLKNNCGIIGFDYPGRGNSTDKFSEQNAYESLNTIYKYLTDKGINPNNISIIAHSLGCAICSKFLTQNNVNSVILISPFTKASDELKYFIDKLNIPNPLRKIIKLIPSYLQPLKFRFNNEKNLAKSNTNILIIACNDDKTVPIHLTQKLKKKLENKTKIQYCELTSGGHDVDIQKLIICNKYIDKFLT